MEKIKNLLKPGSSKDDETLYGSGQSTGTHTGGLTGEGSHLDSATNTTNHSGANNQHTSNLGNTSSYGVTGQNVPRDSTLGGGQSVAHSQGLAGQGSHLSGATGPSSDHGHNTSGVSTTTTTQTHTGTSHVGQDAALGAGGAGLAQHGQHGEQGLPSRSVESSVGNNQASGLSSGTSGPHSSNLANKADPRIDSDNSRNTTQAQPSTTHKSGLGDAQIGGGSIGQSAFSGFTGDSNTSRNTGTTGHNSQAAGQVTPGADMPGGWIDDSDTSRQAGTGVSANNTTSGNHLGRDAAAVGAAGTLGSGIHSHQENNRTLGSNTGSSDITQGSNTGYTGANQGSSPHTGSHGPHSTDTANKLDPSVNTHSTPRESAHEHHPVHGGGAEEADNHHGRNAAIGAGGAGALGLAAHEHSQQKNKSGTGIGSNSGVGHSTTGSGLHSSPGTNLGTTSGTSQSTGPAPHTAGPHPKDYQNVLDPRVTPHNAATQGSIQTSAPSTTGSSGHHSGRDTALGAGGVGVAANTADKHHNPSHITDPAHTTQNSIPTSKYNSDPYATAPSTAQRSTVDPTTDHSNNHHYGRDAVVAGGVGTAAYAAGEHHHDSQATDPSRTGQHGTSTTTSDPFSTGSNTTQTQRSAVDPNVDHSKDHHHGKDAALAGAAVGATSGADKHHEKDLAKTHKEAEKKHEHDLKLAEKEHKKDVKEAEKHHDKKEKKGGFLSFLHRDKSKKYTAEEEAEFDRQEREHNTSQSHTGRNAALGGAAVGAVGTGAYEANKHHDANTDKSLPTAPGNHGIGTGAGTQNALAGNTVSTTHGDTHGTPLDHKPEGKDIGDHLHGDRNRGVAGSSGFPGTSGFADGTTGAQHGGPFHDHSTGSHSHSEATTDQHGHPISSGTATGNTISGSQQNNREFPLGDARAPHRAHDNTSSGLTGSQHQSGHHTGRNAAAVGGAGVVGEHEYRKHHDPTSGQQSGFSGLQQQPGHHTDRDTAAVGGPGLVGEHEQRKHENTTVYQQSGLTSSNTQHQSLPGSSTQHQSGLTGSDIQDQSGHHSGHNATALGGAGGAGLVGEHEYRKSDTTTGHQQSGHGTQSSTQSSQGGYQSVLDPGPRSEYSPGHHDSTQTSESGILGSKTSDLSGRNRLHKDPPSSHPAAQAHSGSSGQGGEAHVPSGGAERERMVEQGKSGIEHDTGVANAHGTSGNNY